MKPIRALALGTLVAGSLTAQAYDVVERYKIIDDKLKTEAMLRPIGHDFFFDIGATANKNVQDVIDDIDKASKFQGTDQEKIDEANRILTKYDKTEQTLKINVALGTPLPSFSAWDVKFTPNFRVYVDVGANIGIRSQKVTNQDLLDLFRDDVPAELQTIILGLDLVSEQGNDIKTICIARTTANTAARLYCDNLPTGKYIVPNVGNNPTMTLFAKADAKAGFFNDYTYGEHFFGNFNLYGMGRADLYQFVTGTQIAKGDSIETPDKMNTETTVQLDYRLGYRNSNYSTFLGVEELKLTKIGDAKEGSKAHLYDYDPLIRFHADARYRLNALSLQPFIGVHKRSGYGFADGMYAGTSVGAHVWGDRLGLEFRAMVDKQYLTLTPRMKLWLMQLEYSLKKPLKDTDEDVKLTALHSVDFRIFF
ncbi:hypothetical protein DOM21_11270 [Bacteriovorax stolpii]|uniref:hypothetical protein n=1 Tax=Bacteriovorax stolpii TaxID=960 RepID=UPI001157DF62|nr:hypothetical protein [Bacteriovorax stolpii]QDK42016.1 hypothetical protein DOM21_11270 [Bacteriovorax stolpii]